MSNIIICSLSRVSRGTPGVVGVGEGHRRVGGFLCLFHTEKAGCRGTDSQRRWTILFAPLFSPSHLPLHDVVDFVSRAVYHPTHGLHCVVRHYAFGRVLQNMNNFGLCTHRPVVLVDRLHRCLIVLVLLACLRAAPYFVGCFCTLVLRPVDPSRPSCSLLFHPLLSRPRPDHSAISCRYWSRVWKSGYPDQHRIRCLPIQGPRVLLLPLHLPLHTPSNYPPSCSIGFAWTSVLSELRLTSNLQRFHFYCQLFDNTATHTYHNAEDADNSTTASVQVCSGGLGGDGISDSASATSVRR